MNAANKIKQDNYAKLYNKISIALREEFYFEALWITYAIIEDRLVSAIEKCGGINAIHVSNQVGRPIKMLGPKILEIKGRMQTEQLLRYIFFDNLLDQISVWATSRNKLMHALAEEERPVEELEKEIYLTANKGQELAKELSKRIQRLVKKVKQEQRRNT